MPKYFVCVTQGTKRPEFDIILQQVESNCEPLLKQQDFFVLICRPRSQSWRSQSENMLCSPHKDEDINRILSAYKITQL
jgi:hypothetical protein